jgi:hypothetical protein
MASFASSRDWISAAEEPSPVHRVVKDHAPEAVTLWGLDELREQAKRVAD